MARSRADERNASSADGPSIRLWVEGEVRARDQTDQDPKEHDEGAEEGQRPEHGPDAPARPRSGCGRRRPGRTRRREPRGPAGRGREGQSSSRAAGSPRCRYSHAGRARPVRWRNRGRGSARGSPGRTDRRCRCRSGRGSSSAGFDRKLAMGGEPDRGQSGLDQGTLLAKGGGEREPEEIIEGALVAGWRVRLLGDGRGRGVASWLEVLSSPVDQGITSGRSRMRGGGLTEDDRRIESVGIAVVADEAAGPSAPTLEPSVETKTSVLWWTTPRSCSRSPAARRSRRCWSALPAVGGVPGGEDGDLALGLAG